MLGKDLVLPRSLVALYDAWRDVPVRRRSSSGWMSCSDSSRPGGQPSTMQPSAGPWLSPKLVTQKRWPNVLPDMRPF